MTNHELFGHSESVLVKNTPHKELDDDSYLDVSSDDILLDILSDDIDDDGDSDSDNDDVVQKNNATHKKNEKIINNPQIIDKKLLPNNPQAESSKKNDVGNSSKYQPSEEIHNLKDSFSLTPNANKDSSNRLLDNKDNNSQKIDRQISNNNNQVPTKQSFGASAIGLSAYNPSDNKKASFDTSSTATLKNIIDVSFDEFADFIVEKNLDVLTFPLAKNILSLINIASAGFSKDNQKFNLDKIKFILKYLKTNNFLKDYKNDDEADEDINDIFGGIVKALSLSNQNSDISSDEQIQKDYSKHQMSFDNDNKTVNHNVWQKHEQEESLNGILTHSISRRFLDFIKNEGKKNYYNDLYSRFHKDDIVKMAYILQDNFLYHFLLESGQITENELGKLPIIGKNKPALNAHYDSLMSPEIMIDFLLQQKLLNPKFQEYFLELFSNKPWFNSGGLETLIQIIGGEVITSDEMHFFIDWQMKNSDIFDKLFDFFDIEKDYSLVRANEYSAMRSKHLGVDSIKAAYMTEVFITLKSANDPLIPEFFELDFSKSVEAGFYAGLNYKDYFLLRGFDIERITNKTHFTKISDMTHKQAGHNLLIL